ncbi:short-chain dehydrogenase/reductase SDR [Lepidopterella palustris CBS 459.81]|uniref:Short-chain dehydrogenase/reductase SDR n=1 Tax=Lepidopterella palustris CBS 459.81 TaxID=1314670 RepID=A0A8E2J958_9PEZI|nr:short-chain dehydrogenase/reductase SDR [Lepidopterella palustris CBS 459.81]
MATASYKGKTVLVTGGAGGLGKAISTSFLEAGANVVLIDVNQERLTACADELSAAHSNRVLALKVNITDEAAVEKMMKDTVSKFGRLDVLVNNAGIMDHFDPVGELSKSLWDRVIAVNLTAPMLTSKLAVNQMLSQEPAGGAILNVASTASVKGFPAGAAYTASKHGIIGLTKNTAVFYSKKNIRCNAILPGPMQTNVADAFADGMNKEGYALMEKTSAYEPGACELSKVASAVLYLCSEAGSACNGACLPVDNGWAAF